MRKSKAMTRALVGAAALALSAQVLAADTDGDGVTDDVDNCTLIANATQDDVNADGIGNACDADVTGDGFVNFGDLAGLKAAFFPRPYDINADFNGDGNVNFADLAFLKQNFNSPAGPSAANCSPPTTGLPADADFGAEMFMRGSFTDWADPPTPPNNFANEGDGIYTTRFAVYAGDHEFKVASSDWSVQRTNYIADPLVVNTPLELGSKLNNEGNGVFNVPADGCFNFSMDTADIDRPVLSMSQVVGDCAIADQGNNNTEAFGVEMFMRGSFNSWADPPAAPNNFINFGGDVYQAQFEILAGTHQFKVANAGWETQRSNDLQMLNPGESITLVNLGDLGGDNTTFVAPADACYEFTLDVTGGTENPTITATQQ